MVCVFHQELFFGMSAEDVAANQEAQDSIRQTMDSLCPPGGSTGTYSSSFFADAFWSVVLSQRAGDDYRIRNI